MDVGIVLGILKKWCFFVFGTVLVFLVIIGDTVPILPNTDYKKKHGTDYRTEIYELVRDRSGTGMVPVRYRDLGLVAHP